MFDKPSELLPDMTIIQIPADLLNKACKVVAKLPFKERGIKISRELVQNTMEILNSEHTKCLPQNCKKDVVEKTPDGLDRRIKMRMNSNTMTATIISDVLAKVGIVKIIQLENPSTGRMIKGTLLLKEWCW